MLAVGLTGGIGSGKTAVCKVFETLGIPVYDADTHAKNLMNTDETLKDALVRYFGSDIYNTGILNRKKFAGIIFSDETALKQANSLIHPAVGRDFRKWASQQTSPYVLEESAILYENNLATLFWKTILVTAPEKMKIQRVRERDKASEQDVLQRMANQWPDEQKIPMADYVVYNDGLHMMIPQVVDIHHQLLVLAAQNGE